MGLAPENLIRGAPGSPRPVAAFKPQVSFSVVEKSMGFDSWSTWWLHLPGKPMDFPKDDALKRLWEGTGQGDSFEGGRGWAKSWNEDSPVNTNFPMVSTMVSKWCRISSIHSRGWFNRVIPSVHTENQQVKTPGDEDSGFRLSSGGSSMSWVVITPCQGNVPDLTLHKFGTTKWVMLWGSCDSQASQ